MSELHSPIRLDRRFEAHGFFWIEGGQERQVPGILKRERGEGIQLSLFEPLESLEASVGFGARGRIPTRVCVRGQLNQPPHSVLLENATILRAAHRLSASRPSHVTYRASTALLSDDQLVLGSLKRVATELQHLEHSIGVGWTWENAPEPRERHAVVPLHADAVLRVDLEATSIAVELRAAVRQDVDAAGLHFGWRPTVAVEALTNDCDRDLEEDLALVRALLALLTGAPFRQVSAERVYCEPGGQPQRAWSLYSPLGESVATLVAGHEDVRIRVCQLGIGWSEMLERAFKMTEDERRVVFHLLSHRINPASTLDTRFVDAVQLAERCSRAFEPQLPAALGEYRERVLPELLRVLEGVDVKPKLRRRVVDYLDRFSERTLQARLELLVNFLPEDMRAALFQEHGSIGQWAEETAYQRNAFSHGFKPSAERAALLSDTRRLYESEQILNLVVSWVLLRQFGVGEPLCREWAERQPGLRGRFY